MKIQDFNYNIKESGDITHLRGSKPIKHHINARGYPSVYLRRDGKPVMKSVHRLLAIAFIPNPDNLPQVNHMDGNKCNNSLDNLEWCTAAHNMQHAYRTGLAVSRSRGGIGQENANSVLTEVEVIKICEAIVKNEHFPKIRQTIPELTKTTFSFIRSGRTWKHITSHYSFPKITYPDRTHLSNSRKIIDGTSGEVFNTIMEAAKSVGRTDSSLYHTLSRGTENRFKYLI